LYSYVAFFIVCDEREKVCSEQGWEIRRTKQQVINANYGKLLGADAGFTLTMKKTCSRDEKGLRSR